MKNKDKKYSNANVAHSTNEDSDFALTCSSFVCHSDEWIIDSAYTFHMCPKKEWFCNLDESVHGSVSWVMMKPVRSLGWVKSS